jgi:hypothetical protein
MASEILRFNFRGDELDVVRLPDGDVGVPLKRLCEVLGPDVEGQRQRLARAATLGAAWAALPSIKAVDATGGVRDLLILPRRSIPMWAATIDASRVSDEVRPKVIAYQDECADVLAAAFLTPAHAPAHPTELAGRPALLARLAGDVRLALLEGDEVAAATLHAALGRLLPHPALVTTSAALEDATARVLAFIHGANDAGHGPTAREVITGARIRKATGLAAIRALLGAGTVENRGEDYARFWVRSDKADVQ